LENSKTIYFIIYNKYIKIIHILNLLKDGNLNGYQKKKYVCKLLYIYILGWEVDFGHMEALNLISSSKYSEKQIVSKLKKIKLRNYVFKFNLTI